MNESAFWKRFRVFSPNGKNHTELIDSNEHHHDEINDEKANEFMKGVFDDFDINKLSTVSRRKFLALLSASAAMAAAGCSEYKDKGEIVPYNKRPEGMLPGTPYFYASTCTGCSNACGILIKTREGRPIKVDGNPDHPVNMGKICSQGQASLLNLYDPVRLKAPQKMVNGKFTEISWVKTDDEITDALDKAQNDGKEISIITHTIFSPTGRKILDDFIAKYPDTKVYSYELFNKDNRNEGWMRSYGSGTFPIINWDAAKVILSLEGDFLGNEGNSVENTRLFVQKRDVMKSPEFNRLYVVEGNMSVTGANADYRVSLRPDLQLEFVSALINGVSKRINHASVSTVLLSDFISGNSLPSKTIVSLVDDLISNRGASIVYAGDTLPADVHTAVNQLNELLGNTGIYNVKSTPVDYSFKAGTGDIERLVQRMNNGNVGVVIHYDSNPVFHFPPDLKYGDALTKVPVTISLTESENETSTSGIYQLPVNHDFESWGDAHTRTGVYSLQQPVIAPLYFTRQKEAVLLTWINGNKVAYEENGYHNYLMNNWEKNIYPKINSPIDFTRFWYTALELGVVLFNEIAESKPNFNSSAISSVNVKPSGNDYVVLLKKSYNLVDGRYANNGWLQELPHPLSKIVWDNYAAISAGSAKELNVENNDLIEINVNGRKLKIPVFIQPGIAEKVIAIETGYGRKVVGEVGSNTGFYANVLMSINSGLSQWIFNNAKAVKAGGSYELISTVEHHSLDEKFTKDLQYIRGIILENTVESFKNNPNMVIKEKEEYRSLNRTTEYVGVKWGMGIDLNKCLGCNQCVVACVAENNIPVVGKDQVKVSREMQWLRIDTYYSGTNEEPKVSNQPMLCQHCDKAPCENVCPVAATTHSPDGLNQMVYNRCVGTRYCSNNCPYKVRRYNFFDFRDHFADGYYKQEPIELIHNPEVTVRSRGVMEKCTFCIQRIMQAREDAIEQNRPLNGNDVKTACQQACPADAIVFGDMNDPDSTVSQYHKHGLSYYVLEDLNVRPNIAYVAKLRNIHPEEKS
jgi:molybdopterin-containing oxidoreductase family iron-sulfur binding subunit